MSNVFFISDLHLGHVNIPRLRVPYTGHSFESEEEHWEVIKSSWNRVVGKRDITWVLGDICFKEAFLPRLDELKGRKRFILGNHDLDAKCFMPYAEWVGGASYYKGYWLTHIPIHPEELRGRNNIHGHVHYATLRDKRYFNACPENIGMAPIAFEEIKKRCPLERQ